MTPERFVAFAGLAFGLLLCALTPPFAAPDEPAHMFRTWSIASGTFVVRAGGAWVPRSYVDVARIALGAVRGADSGRAGWGTLERLGHIRLRRNDMVFVAVPAESWNAPLGYTAPSYTPFGYLAAAPVVALCRWISAPPLVHLYAARVANVIAATLLIALAIARVPFAKWTFALSALVPMSVYVRASASIDALTIAFAYLVIAEGLREAQPAAAAIESFLITAVKPGYLLLPIAAIRKRTAALVIIFALLGIALSLFWAGAVSVASQSRLPSVVHHPITFAGALAHDWRTSFAIRIVEVVGVFGWLDAPVPFAFAVLYLAAMAVVAVGDGPSPRRFASMRFKCIAIFAGTVFILSLTTHVFGPPDRFSLFQGRYLLPVLPLPFIAIVTQRGGTYVRPIAIAMVFASIAQSVWTELMRFYL